MQKTTKKNCTKILAMTLAMLVAFSYSVPITALAGTTTNTASVVYEGGQSLYGKDGKVTNNSEDVAVTMSKTIKKLSGQDEFQITLSVLPSQEIITKTKESDAATVLVMDASGSMETVENNETRIAAAKKEANTFLETYVSGAGIAKRMVAVVEFGSSAKTVTKWVDANAGDGKVSKEAKAAINMVTTKFPTGITKEESFIYWPKDGKNKGKWTCEYGQNTSWSCELRGYHPENDTRYKNHVHQVKEGNDTGGTNIEGGLMLARNLLTSNLKDGGSIAGIGATSVVMLTDGVPTFNVADENESTAETSLIKGVKGGNNEAYEADYKDVPGICRDIKATNEGKTSVYTIAYGLQGNVGTVNGKSVAKWLTGDVKVTDNYSADNADQLMQAFSKINESIEESITTEVVVINDPMGKLILFDEENNNLNEKITFEGNLLRVGITRGDVLDENGKPKLFTYSYKVKLDTEAQGFVEEQVYDTNGKTTLTFRHPSSPDARIVDFEIPSVKGKTPVVPYTVEYYKWDKENKDYPKDPTKYGEGGSTKLWSWVEAPKDYSTEYNSDNYHFVEGDSLLQLTAGLSGNVIKLYYKPDIADVTVKHYYKTDVIEENGTEISAEDYKLGSEVPNTGLYVGERFEAQKISDLNGVEYTLNTKESDPTVISSIPKEGKTIKLYYDGVNDKRKTTSVTVNRIYKTGHFELNDEGRYEEVFTESEPQEYQKSTEVKAHSIFKTSTVEGVDKGYVFDKNDKGEYSEEDNEVTLKLEENANVINLTFVKPGDKSTLNPAGVIVNHNYYLTEKKIVDGKLETIVQKEPTTVKEEHKDYYVGEHFTPKEMKTYDGIEYVSDVANEDFLVTYELKSGKLIIDLDYHQTKAPAETEVTVNHIFRTYDKVYTDIVDEETGEVTGQKVEEVVRVDETETITFDKTNDQTEEKLYVGFKYKASLGGNVDYVSYLFNEKDSTPDGTLILEETGNVIDLYYDRKDDTRDVANIQVSHIYTVELTTVEDGKIITKTVHEGVGYVDSSPEGTKAGDEYTVEIHENFNDRDYKLRDKDFPESVTLHPGTNRTIEVVYVREHSDLKAAFLSVTHKYVEKVMTVLNGVAGYHDEGIVVGETTEFTVDGKQQIPAPIYAGFKFNIDLAPKYDGVEYTQAENNQGTDITLAEGDNVREYTYEHKTELPKTTVTVSHHYTYTQIDEIGKVDTTTTDETVPAVKPFVGEDVKVAAASNGYTLDRIDVVGATEHKQNSDNTVTVTTSTGAVTVDYYYSKTSDNSVRASYEVNHYYRTLDWDDKVVEDYAIDENVKNLGTGYATQTYTAVPNFKAEDGGAPTFKLDKKEATNGFVDGNTITLETGENVVNFYYTQKIDSRVGTVVKVVHNYYKHDVSGLIPDTVVGEAASDSAIETLPGVLAGTYEEVFTGKAENAWVENSFTAEKRLSYGEGDIALDYVFKFADPKDCTIKSLELRNAEEPNLIVMNYVYEYDATENVNMKINHVYRTHDSYTDENTETTDTVIAKFGNNQFGTWDKENKTFTAKEIGSAGFARQTSDENMQTAYTAGDNEMTVVYTRNINTRPGGGGGGGNRPGPTLNPDPITPPVDIPDEDVPLGENPVIIEDEEVPLAGSPEANNEVEILDEDVPLGVLPKTGGIGTVGFFGFGLALLALGIAIRRKEDNIK